MSHSREVRAEAVLEAAQRAVRCRTAFADGEEELAERQNEELLSLNSQMRYYREAAEAKYTPEFRAQLRLAHSVRQVRIELPKKLQKRGSIRCDGCGRMEGACEYALDLVGGDKRAFNADFWLRACVPCASKTGGVFEMQGVSEEDDFVNSLSKLWDNFEERAYRAPFDQNVDRRVAADGVLPAFDMGRYYLGKTCMRKAVLAFQLQTFLLDLLYEVHMTIRSNVFSLSPPGDPRDERCDRCGRQLRSIDADSDDCDPCTLWCPVCKQETELPFAIVESAHITSPAAFVAKKDALHLAIADDKRPAPALLTDDALWQRVDTLRSAALRDEPPSARERALDTLLRARKRLRLGDEEEEEEEEASGEEEEAGRRGRRLCRRHGRGGERIRWRARAARAAPSAPARVAPAATAALGCGAAPRGGRRGRGGERRGPAHPCRARATSAPSPRQAGRRRGLRRRAAASVAAAAAARARRALPTQPRPRPRLPPRLRPPPPPLGGAHPTRPPFRWPKPSASQRRASCSWPTGSRARRCPRSASR